MTIRLRIAKASLVLIIASVMGHALSLIKEVTVANFFGVSKSIDAFYSALLIPNAIWNIIFSPYSVIFIPLFIKYMIIDKEEANKFASVVLNYVIIILLALSAAILLLSRPIITIGYGGFSPETTALAIKLLRILSITALFSGMVMILTSILNSYEHFVTPALSQMLVTVSITLLIINFYNMIGIYTIVFGTLIGLFLQVMVLIIAVWKKGFKYSFTLNSNHPAIREMLGFVVILTISGVIAQCNLLVGRFIASYLSSGSIAALSYADKIGKVPLIVFAGSINTAIYPFFAIQAAEKDFTRLRETFSLGIRMAMLIFLPLTITVIIYAHPTISILFERGKFDQNATFLTSRVLQFFSLQFLFYYMNGIMMRMLFVLQEYKNVLKITIINLIAMITLNLIFIKLVKPPVAGIALATSLTIFVSNVGCFKYLKDRLHFLHGLAILRSFFIIVIISLFSGFAMQKLFTLIMEYIPNTNINQIISIIASFSFGITLFILIGYMLKLEEIIKLYDLIKYKREKSKK